MINQIESEENPKKILIIVKLVKMLGSQGFGYQSHIGEMGSISS